MHLWWRITLAAGLLPTLTGCFIFGIRVESPKEDTSKKSAESRPAARSTAPCDLSDLPPVAADERLPLAVLDFRIGENMEGDVGRALADLCRGAVQDSGRFVLVDRERIADVLGERDFVAATRCDSAACLVEYGKLLGARRMMHGRINRLGDVFVLAVGLTDVDSGEQVSQSTSVPNVEDSTEAIPDLVCQILRNATEGAD
jgi:hypothetical protein